MYYTLLTCQALSITNHDQNNFLTVATLLVKALQWLSHQLFRQTAICSYAAYCNPSLVGTVSVIVKEGPAVES